MNKLKAKAMVELGNDPLQGRMGPTKAGDLHKQSEHVKEWRARWFVLHDRKFYYYNAEEEGPSDPTLAGTEGLHKNYMDTTGMTVSAFEETDSQGKWFGLEVREEFGTRIGGEVEDGQVQRLVTSVEAERDDWLTHLRYASRPKFTHPDDPRAMDCMDSREKFSLLNGKQWCRACGGAFLKVNTVQKPLPELLYSEPVTVCRPCDTGTKRRSRWIAKIPKEQRSLKKKAAPAAATDAVVGGAKRGMKKGMNFVKKGVGAVSSVTAEVTGIDALRVEVKLDADHAGYLTKLGDVRKNWKRRWFLLDGSNKGILTYYEDEVNRGEGGSRVGHNEKGQIDIRHVIGIEKSAEDAERLLMTTQDPETGKERQWQFRASTTEDRDQWVAVLKMAQDKYVGKTMGSLLGGLRQSGPGAAQSVSED
jgi:hypothetical protein